MKTKIIYENSFILVCQKPAGLATQTASGLQEDMVSELKNDLSRKTGTKNPYLGLIHRLDQPVEGLLVFAKEKRAAAELTKQLADGRLRKKYAAVLEGVPQKEEGTLIDYLKKDSRSNLSRVVPETDKDAKRAELVYRILEVHDGCCLAEIEIATGRHHQIRVQMAHSGYPLRNDAKYGTGREGHGGDMSNGSLALCAYALSFIDPSDGKRRQLTVRPQNPAFSEFRNTFEQKIEKKKG